MKVICSMCYELLDDDEEGCVVVVNPPDGEGIKIFCAECWEKQKVVMGLETRAWSREREEEEER